MAYRDSTSNTGDSNVPLVAVPAGVQINDIVIISLTTDTTGAVVDPGDFPTGFTELAEQICTADGSANWIGWKRLSAADTGDYQFGHIFSSAEYVCQAFAFSGRHTTNPPVVSTTAVQNTAANDPTVTANGVTAVAGDDLLWVSLPDQTAGTAGLSQATPTNFTPAESQQNNFSYAAGFYRNNVSAGATGTISSVLTTPGTATAGYVAWTVRIPAAPSTTKVPPPFHRPTHFRRTA
jgi:hypothetical protein